MTETVDKKPRVRVRFAPSPTGYLHIGGARTVLFNWLLARKTGGAFILRIEDTDRKRHVDDSVRKILDDLRWLGLDWDEGPEAGGEFGPYFQSQRLDTYDAHLDRLLESGDAYYAMETPEELAAMREKARAEKRDFSYSRPDPLPTIEQGKAARDAGRPVVVRFKMPGTDITVVDEILGEVTMPADTLEDFVIQKADRFPTYHFACVVDDELMEITHVLRGQEHLMNTPKHVAMQRALGFDAPFYAHLPIIFNMDGSKMSKRDKEKAIKRGETPPEIEVHDFRASGYLPEAIINFISLLGWSPGADREQFTLEETVSLFSVDRIGKTNAKFDREKLIAFNRDWAGKVAPDRLLAAFRDYLSVCAASNPPTGPDDIDGAGPGDDPADRAAPDSDRRGGAAEAPVEAAMANADPAVLRRVLELCAGFRTFPDVVKKAGFLFVSDDAIEFDPKAVKKVLAKNDGAGYALLDELLIKLEGVTDWSVGALEALINRVCDEKGIKLGNIAQPLRVAVTGGTISPSIFESLEMLGKARTTARIRRCIESRSADV